MSQIRHKRPPPTSTPDEVLAVRYDMRLDLKNPPLSMPELLASLM
jgi:hypothetical protein